VFLQAFYWGKDYNIISHHRNYQELVKDFAIVGLPIASEATQASDFIFSLSPDFKLIGAIIAKILYAYQKRSDFNPTIAFLSTRVISMTISQQTVHIRYFGFRAHSWRL